MLLAKTFAQKIRTLAAVKIWAAKIGRRQSWGEHGHLQLLGTIPDLKQLSLPLQAPIKTMQSPDTFVSPSPSTNQNHAITWHSWHSRCVPCTQPSLTCNCSGRTRENSHFRTPPPTLNWNNKSHTTSGYHCNNIRHYNTVVPTRT